MLRLLVMALVLAGSTGFAAQDEARFAGVWKGEFEGHPYAVVTILAGSPLRGTIAKGAVRSSSEGKVIEVTRDASMELFIQDSHIVKHVLRFKTIDPNDGKLEYELKVTSPSEATLTVAGAVLPLKKY